MSNPPDHRDLEIEALRERLSRLGQASLRITQDLDFNSVLQGALDYPRSFTGARVGRTTLANHSGFVRPRYGNAPAHGVELVTAWSVKVGTYSQCTFSSQLLSGFS